jgi:hypothetical protein
MCDEPHLSLALGIKAAESTLFPHKSFQFVAPGPPVELDEGSFPVQLSRRHYHRFTAPAFCCHRRAETLVRSVGGEPATDYRIWLANIGPPGLPRPR